MNKPISPLPWASGSDSTSKIDPRSLIFPVIDVDNSYLVAGRLRPQDAAYIVHACNAYPELVAALRDALRLINAVDAHRDEAFINAYTLLEHLGENPAFE